MLGPDFPWTPIALVIVSLVGAAGVVFAKRGDKAISRAEHGQKNHDQIQEDYERALARRDRAESWSQTVEDYAGRLREQLVAAGVTPESWPQREKP